MCGIAGIVNGTRETLEKMLAVQQSRGPDHTGIEQIGNVMFGHNRLAIIDKSDRSNQPLTGGHMLSYNGEIYNYDLTNYKSDTTALFASLAFWNETHQSVRLNGLNGMFAFAYFDGENNIYLVRDRFGIKPLYFTHQKDFFAFASTPAALHKTKSNWKISEKGLQEYLSLGATMLHSMFEGIEAVPPGHYLTYNIKYHSYKITRWYYPKFIDNAEKDIGERIIAAIERVKCTCDWPQVILLSGGIDSSLVASRYSGREAIHLDSPERQYAEQVAEKFNIKLLHSNPTNEIAEEGLTDFITKSGEPTMAGLIPWITCKEIAKQGYRVAITANGADELFFGYDRMKNHPMEQLNHIQRLFSWGFQSVKSIFINEDFGDLRQWSEISTYLMFDLNKTLDFASMCHSVEVRVPYLDHELVEAALSISMDKHVGRLGNKTILKEMLHKLGFNWDFIQRPKVGFSMHSEPIGIHKLRDVSKKWYELSGYEQLPVNSTGRQQAYHEAALPGLYLWHKIYGYE